MKKRKFKQSLTYTILLAIIGLIIIVQLGASAIGYYEFTITLRKQYKDTSIMLATAGANIVDPDRLSDYLRTGEKDKSYLTAEKRLQNLVDSSGSFVIYIAKVDEENGQRIYIYDVVGESSGFTPYEIGFTDGVGEGFMTGYQAIVDGKQENANFVYKSDAIGRYTTTIAPVYDRNDKIVAICGIVLPMTALTEARQDYLIQLLAWAILLSIVTGAGWYIMMRKKMVIPLRQVADEAVRFSKERSVAEIPLSERIESDSEIGELAVVVDEMEKTLVNSVTELFRITAEKNRIGAELNVATKIQSNILPTISEDFPGRPEIELSAYMDPAREVGGDFYDFFFIDQDHFAMVIADVSGKGIPAALFMMVSKVLIKTSCMGTNCDPGTVLTNVNRRLCESNEIDMFVTVWLGILEFSTGKLVCSNAGHEYPVLGGSHGPMEIYKDRHGFVLGGMDGIKEKSYEIQLEPGDTVFVYTDGVPEAMNHEKEQFGTTRMLETLNRNLERSSKEKIDAIIAAVDEFTAGEEQFDDTTMLCFRYNGSK